MINEEITKKIIGCAYTVHNSLGAGFLEKVYENALAIELRKNNFIVDQQYPIPVFYDGQQVGDFYADLFVNNEIIIEIKAVQNIIVQHEIQLVNYLNGINKEYGLLLNFGASVTIKRKYRVYNNS